ncbi:MAG: hypothetical protein ACR2JU_02380 [Nocardioidaceae bacterium]
MGSRRVFAVVEAMPGTADNSAAATSRRCRSKATNASPPNN